MFLECHPNTAILLWLSRGLLKILVHYQNRRDLQWAKLGSSNQLPGLPTFLDQLYFRFSRNIQIKKLDAVPGTSMLPTQVSHLLKSIGPTQL